MDTQITTRRYDLDWLRVILFGILVPYHALLGFVSYGANIYGYANQDLAGDAVEFIVFSLHAWRLPALFLISGVGTYFLMRRRGWFAFIANRIIRLLIPLVVGIAMWNAVIAYYQTLAQGADVAFLSFWWDRLATISPSRPGHLWFLINLFAYSVAALPLFLWLLRGDKVSQVKTLVFLAVLGLAISATCLKPNLEITGLLGWKSVSYFLYYLIGFCLMTAPLPVWNALSRKRYLLIAGAILTLAILGAYLAVLSTNVPKMNLVINGGWTDVGWPMFSLLTTSFSLFYALNTLLWCLAILAFSFHHLNRPSPVLAELNRAVYPFYIFHMVVIFVGLFYLRFTPWPWFLEFCLLSIGTFIVTAVLYLIFDRLKILRPLVGLGPRKPQYNR